jgi:hypothetical protein
LPKYKLIVNELAGILSKDRPNAYYESADPYQENTILRVHGLAYNILIQRAPGRFHFWERGPPLLRSPEILTYVKVISYHTSNENGELKANFVMSNKTKT